jgi:methyl-accepting chemotaxis protein
MSIRYKAFIAPVVLLVCLALVCAQGLLALNTTNHGLERLSTSELPKRAAIEKLSSALAEAQVLLFRYVSWLGQGVAKANLEALQAEIASQNQRVDAASLELSSRRDLSKDETEVLTASRKSITGYAEQTASMIGFGTNDASMATMMLSQADDTMHDLRAGIDRLAALNSELSMSLARELVAESRARAQFLTATAIAASIAGLVAAWISTMSLVRPLRAVARALRGLVEGRIDEIAPAHAARRDEIGELARALSIFQQVMADNVSLQAAAAEQRRMSDAARETSEAERREMVENERAVVKSSIGFALTRLAAMDMRYRITDDIPETYLTLRDNFNTAIDQLDHVLRSVDRGAREIQTGAESIEHASRELSTRTERQATSLQETAAELGTITATVKRTAQGASHARELALAADAGAKTGAKVSSEAVAAMDEITKSAAEISQIIGVIDEIAFQTSLLALNAGVEAARAGDAGRGFAVVASEVRGLAQRSAEAAKQIKALITTSTRQVDSGVARVAETGKSLERILAQVDEIKQVVAQIAAGAQEQSLGLDHINSAIRLMDQGTRRNAAMAEESTAAGQTLARETRELEGLIDRFQLGGDEEAAPAGTLGTSLAAEVRRPARLAAASRRG